MGIPVGIALGLHPGVATVFGIAGNLVQVPLVMAIIAMLRKLALRFHYAARVLGWLDRLAERKAESVRRYGWLGISMLVGIPIPGTGIWTGAVLASMLRMPPVLALIALGLGVVFAGLLVGAVSAGAFETVEMIW